jgi:lipooligosaccharide transport system permease protein
MSSGWRCEVVADQSIPPLLARPTGPGGPARPASGGLLLRVLPTGLYVGRARVLVERSLLVNRRTWMILLSGFFEPVFYLLALGMGLGALVGGEITGPGGQQLGYAAFIAPGLLAASAMNGAVYDSTFNVFFKIKYARVYDAMLATPLGPVDIALGEIGWALLRGGLYAAGFLTVMLGLGLVTSPWALLALPVALLVAFAFAAVGMAATTFMRSWQDFDLVQLVVLPMFLFSTTFFPLSVYPPAVQFVIACFPLYHAIELMRAFTSGAVGWGLLGHLAYFVVMAAIGAWVASRRLVILLLR